MAILRRQPTRLVAGRPEGGRTDRIRDPSGKVPLVVSYDACERIYNPPMPLLFQWRCRLEDRAMSQNALRDYLDRWRRSGRRTPATA